MNRQETFNLSLACFLAAIITAGSMYGEIWQSIFFIGLGGLWLIPWAMVKREEEKAKELIEKDDTKSSS